ncbi:M20/M25/M40 family metallo-hydrolase [Alicyclobacillaceae bacterium I2511]|nr:M20/M25/M40 family metallo-hydrolase [Alicyclobacillaceae bacterium I2511]
MHLSYHTLIDNIMESITNRGCPERGQNSLTNCHIVVQNVSTHTENVRHEAATFLEEACSRVGLEHVQQLETTGAPLVYADWLHVPGAPTVLVYGHYDVQPPGLPENWTSPAFAPEIREGRLYARGASDDKGQLFLHLKAVEAVLHLRGCLAFNVKMLIEGEEEIGSPALQGLLRGLSDAKLRDHKNLFELTVGLHNRVDLQADVVLISDTPFLFADQPALCMGVRGLCGLAVEVLGPTLPLHSGGYGGLVQNPIHALATMLASLYTSEGHVAVPGFYDGLFPFDVNAFCGGDCQGTVRTLIPRSARATITCRLGVGQDPTRIADALWRHLEQIAPQGPCICSNFKWYPPYT